MKHDRRIALITGQDMPAPDTETSLVVEALTSLGVDSEVVVWRDERDWSSTQLAVLRTPWDYADHPAGFLAWVTRVASASNLRNGPEIIRWNLNKRYMLDLARCGVPIVPTEIPSLGDQGELTNYLHHFATRHRSNEIIVKPAVGINANGTIRSAPDDPTLSRHLSALLKAGDVLVQPFVTTILDTGEVSLIFLGSSYSHAVRKVPRVGDFRVQDNHGGTVRTYAPSAEELETARAALAVAPAPTTYARVDLVDFHGTPVVMELELIEPELFLRLCPGAVESFAQLLVFELNQRSHS